MTTNDTPPQCCINAALELFGPPGCNTWFTDRETAQIIAHNTHMAETIRLLKLARSYADERDLNEINAHLAKLEGR